MGGPIGASRLKFGVVATTLAVVVVGGMAWAYWTTTGSGAGYSKAKTAAPLTTLDVSATTVASLYPGSTGDLLIKISNPNPYPVKVVTVVGSAAVTVDSAHLTCTDAGIVYATQSGLSISVAGGGTATATLPGAVSMSTAASDPCQGAIFTIPVTLTGIQT